VRLLICAGGTGGGVYPALSVLQAIGNRAEAVLWVGVKGGMEADLVTRQNVPFTAIPAAGVHGVSLRALPGNLIKLAQGISHSGRILKEFRPDVLFFTGGYVAVPMSIAAGKIPNVLYVPDVEPGLALKTLAKRASAIALTVEDSRKFFDPHKKLVVTGYPVRPELLGWTRADANKTFELTSDLPVLFIFGGSKGAHLINTAVFAVLEQLLSLCQVLHITGDEDFVEARSLQSALVPTLGSRYHIYSYLHEEMGAAFAAADLVVSRAGASTLGELPAFGLPAILVPYPFAWHYQKVNADYLAGSGAAVVVENSELAQRLVAEVKAMLADPQALTAKKNAMQALAVPTAAENIAQLVLEQAVKKGERKND